MDTMDIDYVVGVDGWKCQFNGKYSQQEELRSLCMS